jgi:hypothetical protein
MKNQVKKYKTEEAQIVTVAQAKVLTQGKQVIHIGQNAWKTNQASTTSNSNVLDLNNRSQVQKFITYFSEVTGLNTIKEEQQEIKKAMTERDQQLNQRMDQQDTNVREILEATKQNTKTIQDNEQTHKQTIQDIANGQQAIMAYLAKLSQQTQHDNTTITTQTSTDISQLTPDPRMQNGTHDSAAGGHDNSDTCGNAS